MKTISITSQFSVFGSLQELPDDIQNMMEQAVAVRKKAYAPYSKFRVGAALLLDNGQTVLGSNQETLHILQASVPNVLFFKPGLFILRQKF
jgi:cytidine deaminase